MSNNTSKCYHCGADKGLHHYDTDQCPRYGREATMGEDQVWMETKFYDADRARLEAAAPELLEACKTARMRLGSLNGEVSQDTWDKNYNAVNALDAAIAKAEGA